MYSYPITGKHCIHIASQEKSLFTYPITRKSFYLYPITGNDHDYSYPIHGKVLDSQENVQIHNPSQEMFIFISHTGNCLCSCPITGK